MRIYVMYNFSRTVLVFLSCVGILVTVLAAVRTLKPSPSVTDPRFPLCSGPLQAVMGGYWPRDSMGASMRCLNRGMPNMPASSLFVNVDHNQSHTSVQRLYLITRCPQLEPTGMAGAWGAQLVFFSAPVATLLELRNMQTIV